MVQQHSITLSSKAMSTSAFAVFSNLMVAVQLIKCLTNAPNVNTTVKIILIMGYHTLFHNNFVLLFMLLLVIQYLSQLFQFCCCFQILYDCTFVEFIYIGIIILYYKVLQILLIVSVDFSTATVFYHSGHPSIYTLPIPNYLAAIDIDVLSIAKCYV